MQDGTSQVILVLRPTFSAGKFMGRCESNICIFCILYVQLLFSQILFIDFDQAEHINQTLLKNKYLSDEVPVAMTQIK